ncbi:hypothetical protein PG997_001973 [Apiospora hydei]|uniref:J domain-containing protein n=1 Tax=Apiospora hydei TaxID=1337664 RepID=A0ABR1X7W1_9PEZI
MPDYKPWCFFGPATAWMSTLTLTPESRTALLDPPHSLDAAGFCQAVPTFTCVTSLICTYYRRSIKKIRPSKKDEDEDIKTFSAGLRDLGHDELWLKVMDVTETYIKILPPNSKYSERGTALLHLKKAQEAYSRIIREKQVARFEPSNGAGAKSSAWPLSNFGRLREQCARTRARTVG